MRLVSGRRFGKTATAKAMAAGRDVPQMIAMYERGDSCHDIARAMGCSAATVLADLRAAGVQIRGQGKSKPKGEESPGWRGGVPASQERYMAAHRRSMSVARVAQQMVRNAMRAGSLVRPDRCEQCGRLCKPDAAHEDYARPLYVRWLCRACHRAWDSAEPKTPYRKA